MREERLGNSKEIPENQESQNVTSIASFNKVFLVAFQPRPRLISRRIDPYPPVPVFAPLSIKSDSPLKLF